MPPAPQWSDDQIEEMLERMGNGETLTSISSDARMPSMASMMRWEEEQDTELGARITQARARGWTARAELAVEAAKTAEDASKGRLSFDAERWFLGKMHPKKFGDKTLHGSDPENPLPQGFSVTLVKAPKPDA